jgi:hypothetical protein
MPRASASMWRPCESVWVKLARRGMAGDRRRHTAPQGCATGPWPRVPIARTTKMVRGHHGRQVCDGTPGSDRDATKRRTTRGKRPMGCGLVRWLEPGWLGGAGRLCHARCPGALEGSPFPLSWQCPISQRREGRTSVADPSGHLRTQRGAAAAFGPASSPKDAILAVPSNNLRRHCDRQGRQVAPLWHLPAAWRRRARPRQRGAGTSPSTDGRDS